MLLQKLESSHFTATFNLNRFRPADLILFLKFATFGDSIARIKQETCIVRTNVFLLPAQ